MALVNSRTNPLTNSPQDVVLTRTETGLLETNVPHEIVHSSPTGFEIGYPASGPTELALNILHQFLPPVKVGDAPTFDFRLLTRDALPDAGKGDANARIVCYRGVASRRAFELRCAFRDAFLVGLAVKNGETHTIPAERIAAWIDGQGVLGALKGGRRDA